MNIIDMFINNKFILVLVIIGLLLFGLKSVGGISQCNGKYRFGSCSEKGKIYN